MNFDEKYISEIVEKVVRECVSGNRTASSDGDIPVGVSNRHIHLTQADANTLF
jgi:propanediol utilization protein